MALFGPVTTVIADAVSYLLSALGIRAIGGSEPHPERPKTPRLRASDLLDGWRFILADRTQRALFLNTLSVSGLIMATEPLLAVLLLGHLGYAPWQYGLVFAAPCIGGLLGSRIARPLVERFGQHRVLITSGVLRACWPLGLAFVPSGVLGMVLIGVLQFGLVTCIGVFNPLQATHRLQHTAPDRVARTLSAWSISTSASIAALTALWGVLAAMTTPRFAIGAAGALLLATPLLLPRRAKESPTVVAPREDAAEAATGGSTR